MNFSLIEDLFRVKLLISLKNLNFFAWILKSEIFRRIFKEIRGFPVLHCNAVGMKQCQGFSFPRVLPGSFYSLSYFAVELLWEHLVTHLLVGRSLLCALLSEIWPIFKMWYRDNQGAIPDEKVGDILSLAPSLLAISRVSKRKVQRIESPIFWKKNFDLVKLLITSLLI